MTDPVGAEGRRPPSRRLASVLLRVLGLALVALVFWQVDWRDNAVLRDRTVLRGRIVGSVPDDWTPETRLRFVVEPDGEERVLSAADLSLERIGDEQVPRVNQGLFGIVRRADVGLLLLGLLIVGFTMHFSVVRWWLLLRAEKIRLPFFTCHRLTFLGIFFNNVVPGATGGDLVKAVYVARRTHKRTEAVVTVLVDRLTGIIALALIAAVVLLPRIDEPQYRELALFIFLFLGGFAAAAMLFFSTTVRRALRVDAIAARLPGAFGRLLRRADEVIFLYRYQKRALAWAMLLSFANQLSIQFVMVLYAHALHVTTRSGTPLPVTDYLAVLPVTFIVSALPLLPGGWGVRETAFAVAFHFVGVARSPAVALSMMNGMTMIFWSLLGGAYFLAERGVGNVTLEAAEDPGDDAQPRA